VRTRRDLPSLCALRTPLARLGGRKQAGRDVGNTPERGVGNAHARGRSRGWSAGIARDPVRTLGGSLG